jgi:NAD(P)-dependent dehydrogenase (short-subunit alcohol dehydrogenase family)
VTAPLSGRVAVVTGAGTGMGRSHALALAALGAGVVVNDLGTSVAGRPDTDTDGAARVAAEIASAGGSAVSNSDSVATAAGGRAVVEQAMDTFGRVDIVVNNAGVLRDGLFEDLTTQDWEIVRSVHLDGAFHVTQPAWRHMKAAGHGRIVFTTSAAGIFGNSSNAAYGAAKAGLVGLTRMLAVEGRPFGITANAIAPLASTRMSATPGVGGRVPATEALPGLFALLTPEHVSPVVAWLASPGCTTSGEVFSVGGGRIARVFVGVGPGTVLDEATVQYVEDGWEQARRLSPHSVPADMGDELALFADALLRGRDR